MALFPRFISFTGVFALLFFAICPSADAVTLKQIITGKAEDSPAFMQTSLAAASRAEIRSAIQAELQQLIAQEIASQMAQEMIDQDDVMSNVKAVAGDALGEMLDSFKDGMANTCKRLADLAQSKMEDVDQKLQQIAEGAPDEDHAEELDSSNAKRHGPVDTKRAAMLQLQIRNKHKGIFDKVKSFVKSGLHTAKGFVKEGARSLWRVVKPAVTQGIRHVVGQLSGKVPAVINSACESAEDKLEKVESKVMKAAEA